MTHRHTCLLITCALAAFGPAAHAGPDLRINQVRIDSAGLDLNTEAGAARFLERLSRAAKRVCGDYPDPSPLAAPGAVQRFEACRAKALASAVASSGVPRLQRLYAASPDARRLARN